MSDGFLSGPQLAALEKVIAQARVVPGVHRELTQDGSEVLACSYVDAIEWYVNRRERNVARGTCPKVPQAPEAD